MVRNYLLLLFFAALAPTAGALAFDYSGEGRDSPGIFRPASGLWAIRGTTRLYFGSLGDTAVPGDYRGDGTATVGIFRPASGLWAVRGTTRTYFGRTGDTAISGDYNGDGKHDIAVFRPRNGFWAIRGITRIYFGASGDTPIPADYQGDGTGDIGIFRKASGLWAIRGITRIYFGASTHRPVPADFTGNGRAEIAVFDGTKGLWAIRGLTRSYFGRTGDLPLPGDYDGDGTAAVGIFRPATGLWAVRGITRAYFGGTADIPVSVRINWQPPHLPKLGLEVRSRNFDSSHLSKLPEAGSALTRLNYLSWRAAEPTNTDPPGYNWELADRRLALGAEHGQTMIVVVGDVPSWAAEFPAAPIYRERLPDFADFLQAAVSRYKNPPYNVKFWELFNEPDGTRNNYGSIINCWGHHGNRYAEMLKFAYPAIKAADPEAQVIFGGLAHDNCIDPDNPADWQEFDCGFLNDVLANGGGSYFDYLNFHYYHMAAYRWGSIRGKTDHFRRILAGHGLSQPIICSETGIEGYNNQPDLERQARFVPVVFARGMAAGLEAVIWFPLATPVGLTFEGGLMFDDLTPKPAYHAYRTMTEQLTGYRYISEVVQSGVEGYSFRPVRGGRLKQILWTDFEGENTREMDFEAGRLRVVDKLGGVTEISDGGAGDQDNSANGLVRIVIGPSPVYVEVFP